MEACFITAFDKELPRLGNNNKIVSTFLPFSFGFLNIAKMMWYIPVYFTKVLLEKTDQKYFCKYQVNFDMVFNEF